MRMCVLAMVEIVLMIGLYTLRAEEKAATPQIISQTASENKASKNAVPENEQPSSKQGGKDIARKNEYSPRGKAIWLSG